METKNIPKTIIIYTTNVFNDNMDFFIKHGVKERNDVDFLFVINGPDTIDLPKYNNVKCLNRKNGGRDFGGWSHGLFMKIDDQYLYQKYEKFILINSSVRGPFLPVWAKDIDWIKVFTDLLTDNVKLAGTTIGVVEVDCKRLPHVQSMLLVTDQIGIQIGIDNGIFTLNCDTIDLKQNIITQKEIGFSTYILQNNYNIACLLSAYKGIDFRDPKDAELMENPFREKEYYGMDIHPYEIIFKKVPPRSTNGITSLKVVSKYTKWINGEHYPKDLLLIEVNENPNKEIQVPEDFDWREYLYLNADVLCGGCNKINAESHWIRYGFREDRTYKCTTNFDSIFNWKTYIDRYDDLKKAGIDTEEKALEHYITYGILERRLAT